MIIIFFILGLIGGSFINAVVYRLNAVESLWERSHCPHCKKKVRWHDNVPLLSFFILSMKCRDCGEKISWQYPVVELSSGIIFALIGKYFFLLSNSLSLATAAFYIVIFSVLLIIFLYDAKYMEIPMLVLWIGVVVAICYLLFLDANLFSKAAGFFSLRIFSGALGGLVAFVFFYGLAWYSKETWMGYGDAYLGLLAGLIVGWPTIVLTLALSFSVGAIFSIGLIAFGKKTLKSQVPFAPFFVVGIFLTIFLPKIFPSLQYLSVFFK
jgi:leader peptidase (prepilin peptidase)/N-methyltransferase